MQVPLHVEVTRTEVVAEEEEKAVEQPGDESMNKSDCMIENEFSYGSDA